MCAKLSAKSGALKKDLVALPISDLKNCSNASDSEKLGDFESNLKDCSNASDSEKSWVILKLCQGTFRKVFIASCCYIRDH